jgi:hypothetical protein
VGQVEFSRIAACLTFEQSLGQPDDSYAGSMQAAGAAAVRTRHYVRPGRRAIVITDLADLRGPVDGTVNLPAWLYWSGTSPAIDLGVASMRRWLSEIVLREAAVPEDLARFLDRETLIAYGRRDSRMRVPGAGPSTRRSEAPGCRAASREGARTQRAGAGS